MSILERIEAYLTRHADSLLVGYRRVIDACCAPEAPASGRKLKLDAMRVIVARHDGPRTRSDTIAMTTSYALTLGPK